VTTVPGGIVSFDYAPQADGLFYQVDASATDTDEFTKLRSKYKLDYGHGTRKVSEVYRLDLQTWRSEKVIADGRYVREFAVTRDGKRVGMITAPDDTVIMSEGHSRVDVWDADTKKTTPTDETWRKTAASPWPWLESLAWCPDGQRFAFCSVFDAYPARIVTEELTGDEWKSSVFDRGTVQLHGYGTPIQWLTTKTIGFLADVKGDVPFAFANPTKNEFHDKEPLDKGVVDSWAWYPRPRQLTGILHLQATPTSMARLIASKPTGAGTAWETIPIIDPNPQAAAWKLPTVQHITWKAPDGTEVGGVLELPFGYKKGDKLPLVVGIHGGPTTATYANLNYDALNGRLYFAAHGYAALYPNYRGSTGYGDKFVTDLVGHENDIEVKDILAGIQHLIKEGIADPDRVGVMGWSNGGYLTNCLITLKDSPVKFKAASSGAGILDTVAEWGFNDEPAYPTVFKKGLPWETPDVYRKTSPIYGLGNVTTPTLIHVGGSDERCPPGHSRMLYRALKEYRKVPTELVEYPGEPHGLTKLSNRKAKMEWDLAWFEKYLKGK
jgi:dipeptidyl aminopeptidase/acylaminoacyl peptidase